MQELLNSIMELKLFILMCCITVPLLSVYASRHINKSTLSQRHPCIWYLFYGMGSKQLFYVCMLYLLFLVTISCLILQSDLQLIHVLLYLGCLLLCVAGASGIRIRMYLLVNESIIAAGIIVIHALLSYAHILKDDPYYLMLYAMGGCCLLLYACYTFLYVFLHMWKYGKKEDGRAGGNEDKEMKKAVPFEEQEEMKEDSKRHVLSLRRRKRRERRTS